MMTANGTKSRSTGSDSCVQCKVVILGAAGVGKTALTVRFLTKRFIGEYCPTLESIYKYQAQMDDEDVRMEILDTAGQSPGNWKDGYAMWPDCFMFVYSITDRTTFEEIISIKRQVENMRKSTTINGVLVGNKLDLLHDRQISFLEGSELADQIGCRFYEVSAADWTQVTVISDLFCDLYREYRKSRYVRDSRQRKTSSSVRFKQAIQKVISGKTAPRRTPTL
ncbi:hypothetical protein ScPMuIL_012854 [Solemya velum]